MYIIIITLLHLNVTFKGITNSCQVYGNLCFLIYNFIISCYKSLPKPPVFTEMEKVSLKLTFEKLEVSTIYVLAKIKLTFFSDLLFVF